MGFALLMLAACGPQAPQREPLTGGDPGRGKALIARAGCGSCHTIEGVEGANSLVGPPLNGFRQRTYIGGVAANSATNLERWLMHRQEFSPRTAMPDLGLSADQARDIAGYLYLHGLPTHWRMHGQSERCRSATRAADAAKCGQCRTR
ncbi:c-type cytochrome [Paraburkholderia rhynchosiae]|uniref:Cytochrome C n=1 Tax=Paraburkholderia rhynchosiae TaxID=487049 RepID=A0A2N7WBS2_9BURK|nr:c-type cytochrome [Paraburkholderia rhynchosiae]PMS26841.1 cytochrome C [Paraburkholderia rhynchosiae]CAB3728492.1 hypothetical protein LMG27174_05581 [Paraburkholderia rhynchosiae]